MRVRGAGGGLDGGRGEGKGAGGGGGACQVSRGVQGRLTPGNARFAVSISGRVVEMTARIRALRLTVRSYTNKMAGIIVSSATYLSLALIEDPAVAWIFQGNPDRFDVDDYIGRYPQLIYWRTPRHGSEIRTGDRAYIWRSGQNAGTIASGTVVELPTPGNAVLHPEALGIDLWRADPPDPNELKTGIRLDDIRLTLEEGLVPRTAAKNDSELSKATIITIPNGTVFPLDAAQSAALERLWGASPLTENADIAASEGERKLRAHYRRERSSSLRSKKLAQVRAIRGRIACDLCRTEEGATYPPDLGEKIFEVHHISPLSQAIAPVRTTLDDLAVLCANCHRAVHANAEVEKNFQTLKNMS